MNYVAIPSLEHFALIKTTTALWIPYDIRSMGNGPNKAYSRILETVPELQLAKYLENKVLNCVKTIGVEIIRWRQFFERFSMEQLLHRESLNQLCWTPQGTVDRRKTAEILIKYEKLEISLRYKLACIYCLENDILTLWNKLPKRDREHFYSVEDPRCIQQPVLVVFWTYYIMGKVNLLDDMITTRLCNRTKYQYAFEKAASSGNKVATEYFLQKLNPKEREESLEKYAVFVAILRCADDCDSKNADFSKIDYSDVLYFLLSQMYEERQISVIRRYPYEVLKCFLDWPWQSFFMDTAILIGDILPQKKFQYILHFIVNKIIKEYKDYDYQKLFEEFWQESSTSHKKYVIEWICKDPMLITDLIDIGAPVIIKLIFDCANTSERETIILCEEVRSACESLIYADRWGKLKLFVQECVSSKNILIKFKNMMKERKVYNLRSSHHQEVLQEEGEETWTKLFQLLDDLIEKSDKKRSLEEVNSDKRHCSLTSG